MIAAPSVECKFLARSKPLSAGCLLVLPECLLLCGLDAKLRSMISLPLQGSWLVGVMLGEAK